MKSNGLLKWLVIPAILLVVIIGIKVAGKKQSDYVLEDGTRLTAEEMKALGIEGDTPRDTVATLVGQVKQFRKELQNVTEENKKNKSENARLLQRERDIDKRINDALQEEKDRLQQERDRLDGDKQSANSLLQELQRKLENLNQSSNNDLPIGLGFDKEPPSSEIQWIEPSDGVKQEPNSRTPKTSYPTSFGFANPTEDKSLFAGEKIRHENYSEKNKSPPKPVYTVAANSTLMGSVAMTALIGRVPVDGTVNDPYPFKVLVGPDNLAANGIDLPDVTGAVLSGTASGDWTLSCVRGQIDSVTFVFNDGTIRTIPEAKDAAGQKKRNSTSGGLGWISDPHGIPCVSGERRSNAKEYLTNQSLLTAAGAGVASLLSKDDKSNNSGSGTTVSDRNGALNTILSGGVEDIRNWMNKLYGQAFAAVYVQPGAKVAVHIDTELAIDYDPSGRKVNHTQGASHVQDLD